MAVAEAQVRDLLFLHQGELLRLRTLRFSLV